LIDVPVSITAVSGQELKAAGVTSMYDIAEIAPGVNFDYNFTQSEIYIRGIGSNPQTAGDESNITTYIDDVYIPAPQVTDLQFRDVERIEILEGPQGTLFGRNSTGGAIRIVTRDPSLTAPSLDTESSIDFSRMLERTTTVYGSTPVSSTLAVSLAAFYTGNDNFILSTNPNRTRDYFGDANSDGIRGKILWVPTDTTRVVLAGSHLLSDDTRSAPNDDQGGATVNRGAPGYVLALDPNTTGFPAPPPHHTTLDVGSAAITQEFGDLTLKSITADVRSGSILTSNGPALGLQPDGYAFTYHIASDALTEEIDLSNGATGLFSWVTGIFYFHNKSPGDIVAGVAGPENQFLPGYTFLAYHASTTTNSYSGFADGTLRPLQNVELTGGLRYTKEIRSIGFNNIFDDNYGDKASFDKLTYRAIAKYKFTEDANVYLSYSTGFKSGVFNAGSAVPNLVNPENIRAWELGAKARVDGITVTAAGYIYSYSDLQQSVNVILPGGVDVQELKNAASATVKGIDLGANGQILPGLTANVGVSFLPTARYDNYPNASITTPDLATVATSGNITNLDFDASGSRLVHAPRVQDQVGLSYATAIAGGTGTFSVNYSYNSGFYFQPGNLTFQDSYNIVNLRMSWTDPSNHYTVGAFGRNLTNAAYRTADSITSASFSAIWNNPRQGGVFVGVKF
jgi:iron complex outermembrane recepter protein